ncbi:MAG: hypothetical protein P8Z31_12235, partial [Gammaproteobacteria bacterium]
SPRCPIEALSRSSGILIEPAPAERLYTLNISEIGKPCDYPESGMFGKGMQPIFAPFNVMCDT